MTEPVHKTDYVSEGLARLLEQYKRKPFIEGWIKALARRLQEIEDATWEVILYRDLANAEGHQLAVIGRIVGITQGSLTVDQFKREIQATLLIIRSQGDPNTIQKVAALIFPPGVTWDYSEEDIAAIRIRATSPVSDSDALHVYRMVNRARQGGVRLIVDWSTHNATRTFSFRELAQPPDATIGFSEYGLSFNGGFLLQEQSSS